MFRQIVKISSLFTAKVCLDTREINKAINPRQSNTLGVETFAGRNIREIFAFREHKFQNRSFREWTEKLNFFVVLRKSLDPDRNKREKKTLLFRIRPLFRAANIFLTLK